MNQNAVLPHMQVLGVDWGASADTVKRAFRTAAKRAHPDIAGHEAHDLMSQINAAYAALKDGVPTREQVAPPQGQSTSAKKSLLKTARLTMPDNARERMRTYALSFLAERGVTAPNPSWSDRLLRRTPSLPIQVPASINIRTNVIEIELECETLARGTNYVVVPVLKVRGQDLVGTGELEIVRIEVGKLSRQPFLVRVDHFGEVMLPGYPGIPIALSTLYAAPSTGE